MKFTILISILFCLSSLAHAEPLKFKAWKEQQILDAQNEVLRLTIHLQQLKNGPKAKAITPSADQQELLHGRFELPSDVAEKDLKRAQENLQISKEYSLEDYVDVYVSPLQDDPSEFSKLMDSLSKDEIAQLMRVLIKDRSDDDASHSDGVQMPVLMSSARHS